MKRLKQIYENQSADCSNGARLSFRHQLFCYKYLVTQNATEAYLLAGYKVSRETARRNGARLLTNADILTFIAKTQQDLALEAKVSVAQVIQQLSKIAFGNGIGGVVFVKDDEFHLRENANLDGINQLCQKIYEGKKKKSRHFMIRAEDRIIALDLLCKILGLYGRSTLNQAKPDLKSFADKILQRLKDLEIMRNKKLGS